MRTHKMKKHTKIGLIGVSTLAVVGVLAFAGSQVVASGWEHGGKRGMGGTQGAALFERFDADGDDRVTRAEVSAFQDNLMSNHDADGNASINLQEFQAIWLEHMRPRMVDGFQRLDDDGDGEITKAELDTKLNRMLRWMDRNDDGAIDYGEIRGHRKGYGGHWRGRDDDDEKDRS